MTALHTLAGMHVPQRPGQASPAPTTEQLRTLAKSRQIVGSGTPLQDAIGRHVPHCPRHTSAKAVTVQLTSRPCEQIAGSSTPLHELTVGAALGENVGSAVGDDVGTDVVGCVVGTALGDTDGGVVGRNVGLAVGAWFSHGLQVAGHATLYVLSAHATTTPDDEAIRPQPGASAKRVMPSWIQTASTSGVGAEDGDGAWVVGTSDGATEQTLQESSHCAAAAPLAQTSGCCAINPGHVGSRSMHCAEAVLIAASTAHTLNHCIVGAPM